MLGLWESFLLVAINMFFCVSGNAFIFDFFKSEKQKCIDELMEHSYLRDGENYSNSRDVRHIHCLCDGTDAEICDKKYYGG